MSATAAVSGGCARASRLAIRALRRFFVPVTAPSKLCSSLSMVSESITAGGSTLKLFHLLRKITQPFDIVISQVRQLLS